MMLTAIAFHNVQMAEPGSFLVEIRGDSLNFSPMQCTSALIHRPFQLCTGGEASVDVSSNMGVSRQSFLVVTRCIAPAVALTRYCADEQDGQGTCLSRVTGVKAKQQAAQLAVVLPEPLELRQGVKFHL